MSEVPITITSPGAREPLDRVKSLAGGLPFVPFKTSKLVTEKSMATAPLFQSSIPFGSVPESVSTYCEITSAP